MVNQHFGTNIREIAKREETDAAEKINQLYHIVKPVFFGIVESARNGTDCHLFSKDRKAENKFFVDMLTIKMAQGKKQGARTLDAICNLLEKDSADSLTRNWAMYGHRSFAQTLYGLTTSTEPHKEGLNGKIKVDCKLSKFIYSHLTAGGNRERRMLKRLRGMTV